MRTDPAFELTARFAKLHLEDLIVLQEVLVCRVHSQIPTQSHGTDEEVSVRALDSALAAAIERISGCPVVSGFEREVWERLKVVARGPRECLHLHTRQGVVQYLAATAAQDRTKGRMAKVDREQLHAWADKFLIDYPSLNESPPDTREMLLQIGLALQLFESILGREWRTSHLPQGPHIDIRGLPTDGSLLTMLRVIQLAETLFDLQDVPGFDACVDELRDMNDMDSVVGHLESARLIQSSGVPMRFVRRQNRRGADYDVEVTDSGSRLIACELKAKSDATDPRPSSLLNILRKAADQLPSDSAGMVFVRIPYNWTLTDQHNAGFGAAVEAFHRNQRRIVATCCHWERITSHAGPLCYSTIGSVLRNAGARFASDSISRAIDRIAGDFYSRTEPTSFEAIARTAGTASIAAKGTHS